MKWMITLTGCIVAIVSVNILYALLVPAPAQLSSEEMKANEYYSCVRVQSVNSRDINNCNNIR